MTTTAATGEAYRMLYFCYACKRNTVSLPGTDPPETPPACPVCSGKTHYNGATTASAEPPVDLGRKRGAGVPKNALDRTARAGDVVAIVYSGRLICRGRVEDVYPSWAGTGQWGVAVDLGRGEKGNYFLESAWVLPDEPAPAPSVATAAATTLPARGAFLGFSRCVCGRTSEVYQGPQGPVWGAHDDFKKGGPCRQSGRRAPGRTSAPPRSTRGAPRAHSRAPRRPSRALRTSSILDPPMPCTHPDPIPLGTRHDLVKEGKKTQEWNRLGSRCKSCGALQLTPDGPWISKAILERVEKQAACPHSESSARYKRGEMYEKENPKTGKITKVQPWDALGKACDLCGLPLSGPPKKTKKAKTKETKR